VVLPRVLSFTVILTYCAAVGVTEYDSKAVVLPWLCPVVPSSHVTLSVESSMVNLYFLKCPLCDFVNVYEDTVTHHIKYTDDILHNVDLEKIDKSTYVFE
jgi:hypothetical protein